MSRAIRCSVKVVWLLIICLSPYKALAVVDTCDGALRIDQSFSSGASWTVCASVSEQHALEVTSVHYRAPGDTLRSVLDSAHVGQILMHYHDEIKPRAQIGTLENSRLLIMSPLNCDGTLLLDNGNGPLLCSRIEDNRTQAKFATRPSVQSQRWELSTALQRGPLVWAMSISFDEDGRITPAISLSGRARSGADSSPYTSNLQGNSEHLVRATVLATWRLVFNVDDGDYDHVQQFDFQLDEGNGHRRAMQVSDLTNENFFAVNRDDFRGWRVVDTRGSGYFLDPFNSGFSYTVSEYPWASYDLALTRHAPCERYALNNPHSSNADSKCGQTLDDFVNGEDLNDAHPVLWFSQSRTFNPTEEDWPVISNFYQSFTLLPYDWTRASPFEVSQ